MIQASHSDLFDRSPPALPAGFRYQPDLISLDEERQLVQRIADLPLKEFEFQGFLGKRRIASFGWRYDFNGGGLQKTDDIPSFLNPVREQAARFARLSADRLQQVLITEHRPGVQIGWHKYRSVFGEVIGISLLSSNLPSPSKGWKQMGACFDQCRAEIGLSSFMDRHARNGSTAFQAWKSFAIRLRSAI